MGRFKFYAWLDMLTIKSLQYAMSLIIYRILLIGYMKVVYTFLLCVIFFDFYE